jgi:iron complex transport system permease protein
MGTPRREIVVLALLLAGLVIAFLLSLALGSVWIPLERVSSILLGNSIGENSEYVVIIQTVRLPRALTALLAGAALGIAGLQMQTLFRNPLADPFALGIASGASLGVALVVLTSGATAASIFGSTLGLAGDAMVTAGAVAGAAAALSMVLALSTRVESPATMLIMGLMFGYAAQAFTTVLVAGAEPGKLQDWVRWGFGSFGGVTWQQMRIFVPLIVGGLAIAAVTTKQLNALLLGEGYAASMGLNVRRMRFVTMAGASILGGVVTAFCGPVAFLGVAIPHMCRALLGSSDHRALVPSTILMGGIVALLSQTVSAGRLMPLNAITSLIGAPFLVFVLLRNRRGVFTA